MVETATKEQFTVRLRYLHIAPRKVRLIANTLRGLSVGEAEAQLLLRPQRSANELLKLLRSAASNIRRNPNLKPEDFFISRVFVDQGPMLKRSLPRAQGRATPIQKKQSHVTLVLERSAIATPSRFTIIPKEKKQKSDKKPRRGPKGKAPVAGESEGKLDSARPQDKPGFLKKIFQRKSV